MPVTAATRRLLSASAILALTGFAGACASSGAITPPSATEQEADNYLFTNGTEALNNERWLTAREYFRRLVDTYPTSRFRQDAKLGIGDSYLGETRIDSDILAAGEFREFLRFYPLADRADYAQYRLALSQFRQMLGPQRDQTATRDALRELQVFTTNYPNSKHLPEVAALDRQVRDRLSESEFLVGRHYYRTRWYPGAVTRLEAVMKSDPQYTGRDGVYFYLAEAYAKQQRHQDARAYYQKVLDEFAVSEYLDDAQDRIQNLAKVEAATPPAAVAADAPAPVTPASQTPATAAPAAGPATPAPAASPASPTIPVTR